MKRFIRSICFVLCILMTLSTGVALAADSATTTPATTVAAPLTPATESTTPKATDNKEYYLSIYNQFQNKPLAFNLNTTITTPIGNADCEAIVIGVSPDAKSCKVVMKINWALLGKEKQSMETTTYIEQDGKNSRTYSNVSGQWVKQTTNNLQVFGKKPMEPSEAIKLIKSVELLSDTPEKADIKIVYDFSEMTTAVEKVLLDDKSTFKKPEDKAEFMEFYKLLADKLTTLEIIEHIDKTNKAVNTEIDLTTLVKDISQILMDKAKNLKEKDRAEIEKFVNATTVKVTANTKILDKAEIVKIPKEVKKSAKDIKILEAEEKAKNKDKAQEKAKG